jgi:hypothetical protein
MNNTEEQQTAGVAAIQEAYMRRLNAAAQRQATDDKYWWHRLPVPKTLKLQLPRPRNIPEHIALEFWVSILKEKLDVDLQIELV